MFSRNSREPAPQGRPSRGKRVSSRKPAALQKLRTPQKLSALQKLSTPRKRAGQAGELFPGSLRLTRRLTGSAATGYDRARYRWSIGAERWRTRRDEQELRAQGSLIHLDLRLTFTVLVLWVFTAAALTVGTWRVVHPLACVLIALLGCLAILLFFPPRAVMPYSLLFRTTGQLVFLACIVTVQAVLLCATGVDASRATLQQAQGASLRLNGTVEQVRRVDPRTTLVVIKLEEIQGRSVRALVNERVRVYRRDGSAKSTARSSEASSAGSVSAAKHRGNGTKRSQAIYPGMKVTALGTVEFNGSTAKLSGATIFPMPAPAYGAGSNASVAASTAEEPYLSTLKEQLRTRALDTLGTESAALVLGTAYGDDSLMSSTAREDYKLSGLSHITAVSGANIAIVFLGAYRLVLAIRPYRFASVYLLFRSWKQRLRGRAAGHSRPRHPAQTHQLAQPQHSIQPQQPTQPNAHALPPLVHRLSTFAIPHRVMVLCGVAAVLAYAMLLDSEGSVIRSLAMGLLGAYAMLRGSGRQSLAALQTTVLMCLLAAPHLAVDMGFALSVTATSALILLGPPLIRLLMRVMPVFFAEMLAAPIVASLWCTPLILAMSGQVPLYSVPANLVAAPLAPLSMLAGLAALGFMLLGLPTAADLCLRAGGLAAQGIEWAAHTAAHAPGNPWEPGSNVPAVVCSALCVLTLSVTLWCVDARRYRAVTHRQYLRVVQPTAPSHQPARS